MKLAVSEVLINASKLKRAQEKIDYLRQNDSMPLKTVLQGIYDPRVRFILPDGPVPYSSKEPNFSHGMLYSEARKLVYFIEGGPGEKLDQKKLQLMFIDLLEKLLPSDAELIIAMKDKKMPYKGIDEKIVREVYPEFFVSAVAA